MRAGRFFMAVRRFLTVLRPRQLAAVTVGLLAGAILWLLPLERPRYTLQLENGQAVWHLGFSPDGTKLAITDVTSTDGNAPRAWNVRLWDVATGELAATLWDD